jgi:inosose dehydratase
MRKHHQRTPYLDLKSVDRDRQQAVESEGITFAPAVGDGVFCEPSTGAVDFDTFRDVLQEINYHCGPDKPLPIARKTREYLNEIGIG